ncbi:acylphosphatase [Arthrobacter sp. KK5.5]|uniref:acylphosphatase n=1 Tax=Arthrobacter sp. KK5.5 TaxID=3373084 RepID=UPI003EE6C956
MANTSEGSISRDGDADIRLEATVTGRVQGVGFRYTARETAVGLGLVGEAVNLRNGSVRVVAEGSRRALDALLEWLESDRTPGRVGSVEVLWVEPKGDLSGFDTR